MDCTQYRQEYCADSCLETSEVSSGRRSIGQSIHPLAVFRGMWLQMLRHCQHHTQSSNVSTWLSWIHHPWLASGRMGHLWLQGLTLQEPVSNSSSYVTSSTDGLCHSSLSSSDCCRSRDGEAQSKGPDKAGAMFCLGESC